MIHLKYYLILIITLFLALGLGMAIGISLESKDILEKQQTMIAQQLEEEFIGIRNENRQLKDQMNVLADNHSETEELCDVLFNSLIQNKLEGLRVSIVETSEKTDYSELIRLLKLSGASIESNITLKSDIFSQGSDIKEILEATSHQQIEGIELYVWLAENLVESLSNGQASPFITRLNELHLVRSLIDIQNGCDVIILAGNGKLQEEQEDHIQFDLHFIKSSLEMETPVIAVESKIVSTSAVADYKKLGISTVDNVDTIYGRLSLISLLSGNFGNFGIGEGSDALMPSPLFPNRFAEDLPEYNDDSTVKNN